MAKNPLLSLRDYGQSLWYDNISRELLQTGELARSIQDDGVVGVTTNPTILQKATSSGNLYDADLARLAAENRPVSEIYETLVMADIRAAADLLRPVYEQTDGLDGYVSLEVSPHLAHDTAATIAEGKRLFATLDRPNTMIKVPATNEGVPAISELTAAGLNVNVTLIFALNAYEAVAHAYIEGLEARVKAGQPIDRIASVASFFVSRVDTVVDKQLAGRPEEEELRGKAGIANARLAYARFQGIFSGPRWQALAERGARVQRPLWASTSTKDPRYPDTMYAEALIGPHTIDTMPPATIVAFRDHGRVAETITQDVPGAGALLERLAQAGIDMGAVTHDLLTAGLKTFSASFDELMAGLANKVDTLVARSRP